MFYQNVKAKSHRKILCEADSKQSKMKKWCNTKLFRMSFLSSNNLQFFIGREGYVICENDSGHDLVPVHVSFTMSNSLWAIDYGPLSMKDLNAK